MKIKQILFAIFVVLGIPWLTCRFVEYRGLRNMKEQPNQMKISDEPIQKANPDKKTNEIPVLFTDSEPVMMPLEE